MIEFKHYWLLFFAFAALVMLGLGLLIHFYGLLDRIQPADAIVILAGPTYRADHAIRLWRAGIAPVIVCTGGMVEQKQLAENCRDYLIRVGVPYDAIVLENKSLSTEEHALYLKPIMEELEWDSIVIVSSSSHLFRAMLIFNQYGILTYPSPASNPDATIFNNLFALSREVIAVFWHVVKTVLGLHFTRIDWI